MSMQQYYVSPQRTEHSIDNILDHFDVIRVGYNGNKHGKSHNHVEILPTINTVSVSVKDHFEVIHIDGDDNKLSKSHKAVERTHTNNFDSVSVTIISKSGKHEKSSKKSSGDDGHIDIEHFRSRSRRSWSDGGGGTGTVKSGKIRASKGDKGGKSLASIGHKSGKTQYVSGSSSERSGKSGKGSGKSGKGSSWW